MSSDRGRPRRIISNKTEEACARFNDKLVQLLIASKRSGEQTASIEQLVNMTPEELDAELDRVRAKRVPPSRFELAFYAAVALNTLERGTPFQEAFCEDRIRLLRRTGAGRAVDPNSSMKSAEFLEQLIQKYAPGWRWRDQIDNGSRQRRNERIARDTNSLARHEKAIRTRFITADEPDAGVLCDLRRRISAKNPATWATLRELKLATAVPERAIKKMIADLRPRKNEIVTVAWRHKFVKRGACPKRFGPRLIICVLNEFVKRLQDYDAASELIFAVACALYMKHGKAVLLAAFTSAWSIERTEQVRLRKLATDVKRSLASKLGHLRSTT